MTDKKLLLKLEKILALTSRTHQPEVDGDRRGWEPVAAHRVEVIARVARAAIRRANAAAPELLAALQAVAAAGGQDRHGFANAAALQDDDALSHRVRAAIGQATGEEAPSPDDLREQDRGAAESERLDNLSREQ